MNQSNRIDDLGARERFPVTRWSVVLAARQSDEGRAAAALDELCQAYWFPIYVYVRRRGFGAADAEDLTQGYFAALIQRNYFAQANAEKGKLRSFLLTTLKHFIADEGSKAAALKRGHGKTIVSLDAAQAEERYGFEPVEEASPDKLYEKRWALTVLDNVLTTLRADYVRSGQGRIFDVLQPYLAWNSGNESYRDVAATLGMKETAVRVAILRLRRRYGDLLRAQIADTVSSPEDVPAELDYLFSLLR